MQESDEILVEEIKRLKARLAGRNNLKAKRAAWIALRVIPPLLLAIAVPVSLRVSGEMQGGVVAAFWFIWIAGGLLWSCILGLTSIELRSLQWPDEQLANDVRPGIIDLVIWISFAAMGIAAFIGFMVRVVELMRLIGMCGYDDE